MTNDDWFSKQDKEFAERLLRAAKDCINPLSKHTRWQESDLDEWHKGVSLFQEVNSFVKQIYESKNRMRHDLPDPVKDLCAEAWIGQYYCHLHVLKISGPKALQHDSHRPMRQDITNLEREIKSYGILHVSIWNLLSYTYDQWSEEWRTQGLKEEADELQAHMLKARSKYRWWGFWPWLVQKAGRSLLTLERVWIRFLGFLHKFLGWFFRMLAYPSKFLNKSRQLFDALRASIEYLLFRVGKGLVWPFVLFVFLPIICCGSIYYFTGVCIEYGGVIYPLPPSLTRVGYSILFSAFVFTGSEPGQLTSCPGHAIMYTLMAFESLGAFVVIALIIGYMVNRLSSR